MSNVKTKKSKSLDVSKIVGELAQQEDSYAHRHGSFKIDAPFERALDTILKSKAEAKGKKPHHK